MRKRTSLSGKAADVDGVHGSGERGAEPAGGPFDRCTRGLVLTESDMGCVKPDVRRPHHRNALKSLAARFAIHSKISSLPRQWPGAAVLQRLHLDLAIGKSGDVRVSSLPQ